MHVLSAWSGSNILSLLKACLLTRRLSRCVLTLQILEDVGLRSEMNRDTFTACAKRIAASGVKLDAPNTPAAERHTVLDTAAALARYFVANVSSLHSNNFYEGIGALPWVPATKVYPVL